MGIPNYSSISTIEYIRLETDDADDSDASDSSEGYLPGTTKRSRGYITVDGKVATGGTTKDLEVGESSNNNNIFKDPDVANYYRNLYEEAQYEGRHAFAPNFEWTEEEEQQLVWKLEWHVALWASIMFMALQMDRGNISQALSDNMLGDLNMTTNDYNMGQSLFYISFLGAELPSQLISKKLGPDRWVPLQMTLWSIVAISQSQVTGRTNFFITRVLLGLLEGGFIADVVLWLSYFYTSKELPFRLSIFWTASAATQIITSVLAFGILRLRGLCGWEGWRWLFFLEGFITLLVGGASFFLMPASPVQTKTWFRPNGWFTDREELIVVNRVLRDDPSKGDMHNREAITLKLLWYSITDYDLWPLYLLGLFTFIPVSTTSTYLTLTLRSLGFDPFSTNLLTIPAQVTHIIFLLLITWASERYNERTYIAILQPLWLLPCIAMLRWWKGSLENIWGTYAILTVLLSAPYIHAILVSWCSRNSNTVRTRTVSAALYNMFVQAGGIIASNIYRKDDLPKYHRGNTQLFGIAVFSFLLFLATKSYYVWRNKSRDRIWNSMTSGEQNDYRMSTTDLGNKRLDFRFAH